jgi:MHS family proline/betaine transporter-like MFS transporter
MLSLFTPEQRYSGIACFLNIGIALMGGTCSMICLWLINVTSELHATAYYWNFVAGVFLLTLYYVRPKKFFTYFVLSSKQPNELTGEKYGRA